MATGLLGCSLLFPRGSGARTSCVTLRAGAVAALGGDAAAYETPSRKEGLARCSRRVTLGSQLLGGNVCRGLSSSLHLPVISNSPRACRWRLQW